MIAKNIIRSMLENIIAVKKHGVIMQRVGKKKPERKLWFLKRA